MIIDQKIKKKDGIDLWCISVDVESPRKIWIFYTRKSLLHVLYKFHLIRNFSINLHKDSTFLHYFPIQKFTPKRLRKKYRIYCICILY
jgi:hypothetical protein